MALSKLKDVLLELPDQQIFRVDDSVDIESVGFRDWLMTPIEGEILNALHGLYILRAYHIFSSTDTSTCFVGVAMPERVADFVFHLTPEGVELQNMWECDGEVVCAVPIEGFGDYELFLSKADPEVGLSVLRRGLELATQKTFIAEDLGFILRDLGRAEEAVEAFSISAAGEPSSYFIYLELADLYAQLGQEELSQKFRAKVPAQNPIATDRPWWKFW